MIKCVVIKWVDINNKDYSNPSAYEVSNPNYEVTSFPVGGLQDDLEVLIKRTPFIKPPIDMRVFKINEINGAVDEFDSEYPTVKKWITTYEYEALPKELLKVSIDEAELFANLKMIPSNKQLKNILLYIGLERKERKGGTMTPSQLAFLAKGDTKVVEMWQNHLEALQKKNQVDNNVTINLDEGFIITEIE